MVAAARGPVAFPMLRQQTQKPPGRANRSRPTTSRPPGDHLGGFAVTIHGADALAAGYEAAQDDYRSIMVKALADRLAEAFAEHIHLQARRDWYEPGAQPGVDELHAERFRGIRPALGYPASPDHSPKRDLFSLLGAAATGHVPDRVVRHAPAGERQRADLRPSCPRGTSPSAGSAPTRPGPAERRGLGLAEVERWLRPNLSYQPR